MRIKLLLICAAILSCTMSFAQFTQGKSQSNNHFNNGWRGLYVQYNGIGANYQFEKEEYWDAWKSSGLKDKMSGVTLGYNQSTKMSQNIPLFIEYGGGAQYAWYSGSTIFRKYHTESVKISYLSIKVPISIAYQFLIPNTDLSIEPNAGLDFRLNVYGKADYKDVWKDTYWQWQEEDHDYINLLDKKDNNGSPINIFQIGWHIGLNVVLKNYFIGISYGSDLSKIYDGYADVKLNQTSVTAGFRF